MVEYEVTETFGVIGKKKDRRGEPTEVRLCKVAWSGSNPMWDLRCWSMEEKPLKGLTLTNDMMRKLKELLDGIDL